MYVLITHFLFRKQEINKKKSLKTKIATVLEEKPGFFLQSLSFISSTPTLFRIHNKR